MGIVHASIFRDVIGQALHSLADNKLRTVLSIIGIAIGVGAVMTVGTVTQGLRDYVFQELQTYGLKSIWIYRDWGEDQPNRKKRQGSGITNDDLKLIQGGCCVAVIKATPVVYSDDETKINSSNNQFNASMEGVGIDYIDINNDRIVSGRNIRKNDILRRNPVAVVGPKVIKALYGEHTNVKGKSFRFYGQKYKIIGVLEKKNRDLLAQMGADKYDINGRVLIPYTVYQKIMGSKDIHTLQAEAGTMETTGAAINQLREMLERRHSYRYTYKTESMDDWVNKATTILRTISVIGLLFASIALLVGGIGIMNIMSTSVIERTREIGIRKALGAHNKDILFQFLLEAAFVSTIGGVIGMTIGAMVAQAIGWVSGYPLEPSWSMAIVALVVSASVGIASGYYPASRAARLKPVDALRYE